jgi:hypothetical protein
LGEETMRQREDQRSNDAADKPAADSVDVVCKHSCFLPMLKVTNCSISSYVESLTE